MKNNKLKNLLLNIAVLLVSYIVTMITIDISDLLITWFKNLFRKIVSKIKEPSPSKEIYKEDLDECIRE